MDARSKVCPSCHQQIQADALFCAYCGARFTTGYQGYCPNCHTVRDLNASDRCAVCGGEVIDRQLRVVSQAQGTPAPPRPGQITDYPPAGAPQVQPVQQWEKRGTPGCAGWMRRILVAILVFLGILLAVYYFSDNLREKITSLGDQAIGQATPTVAAAAVTEEDAPRETSTPYATTAAKINIPPIPADGVCAGGYGYGYTCLDDGGWTAVPSEELPDTGRLADLAACPNEIYLMVSSILYGYSDGKWMKYGMYGGTVSGVIGCGANDDLWIFDNKAAYYFDGASFTEYIYDDIFEDVGFLSVNKVVVTGDGEVWVVSNENVVHYDGADWTVFGNVADLKTDYRLTGLAVNSSGVPWIAFQDGLASYDGTKWVKIAPPGSTAVNTVYIDPQDQLWVGTDGGVSMFLNGSWQRYPIGKQAGGVINLGMDTRQRMWVGTDYGLGVLDKGNYTFYQMANADLLTNDIENMIVLGSGPSLPEKIEKQTGSLSGRLTNGTEPLKNARVEVCVQSINMFFSGATPCADQPFQAATNSDAEGQFTIANLPPGYYILTIQGPDGKWKVRSNSISVGSIFLPVLSGEDNNLGVIDIKD